MTDEETPSDEHTPKRDQSSTIAARLEHLFKVVHPADRGPYSNAEVAERINTDAGEQILSATYLWQLKTGKRTDPTHSRLTAIAKFFGVSPMYFYEDEAAERANEQLRVLSALRDEGVRKLVLRADGLSPRGLAGIAQMIEAARTVEGLPDGGDAEQSGK
ncbi:helix-turn-helix domain-containing protein [Streptacidiphilus albus]|uniref:helix-turn-helix domain-containing protein n=1 Tax=Streptacidiphilus albus TaxID=105425 RepID=UPI0005A5FA6C|nr:helix-turn-helix domain-containing protein [Streptacidiphilus albus]